MGKPRLYGMNKTYIPNAKADARFKKKFFEKGKAFADDDEERHQQRICKELKREKERWREMQNE